MNILLVNDDGVFAEGIIALARALAVTHKVFVVAPACQQSGMSQALSVGVELCVQRVDIGVDNVEAYSVGGTPADCTKLALEILVKDKIDLVISGINKGANVGTDVLYSGTVGAAVEGYNHSIPSIAVSAVVDFVHDEKLSFDFIAETMAAHLNNFYNTDELFIYNINFPIKLKDDKINFVWAKQGYRLYENEFDTVTNDDGSVVYKMHGRAKDIGNDESTDIQVVNKGFISVTPLSIERTDFAKLKRLSQVNLNFGGND